MTGCREVAMTRVLILIFMLSLSGCASMADYRFRFSVERKARLAWQAYKSNVNPSDRTADFADGFKSGYVDVSRGGNGDSPAVPPPCYWEPRFQTPEGKIRVERWYSGFTLGATTAMQWGYQPIQQCSVSVLHHHDVSLADHHSEPSKLSFLRVSFLNWANLPTCSSPIPECSRLPRLGS